MLSRRSLLWTGLAAATAVAAAGGLVFHWWEQPAGVDYKVISPDEAAFLRSLAGAAFPPGEVIALDGETAGLDHYVDEILLHAPDVPRDLVRLLMHAVDEVPLLTRASSFEALDLERRFAVLDAWLNHPRAEIRSAVMSLVVFLGMGYTTHPDVAPMFASWSGCGYGR